MKLKSIWSFVFIIFVLLSGIAAFKAVSDFDPLTNTTQEIAREIMTRGQAYSNLRELVAIGPRLAGSENSKLAIAWAKQKLLSLGLDRVWLQPVSVYKWERGTTEIARMIDSSGSSDLLITTLGNSVGTPAGGIDAEVVEVQSLGEVAALGDAVRNKIVFFNRPMDESLANAYAAYGGASDQRFAGARVAAKQGAVGVIVRSLAFTGDNNPHTGVVNYSTDAPKIPGVAVSTGDADKLSQSLKANAHLQLHLELSAQQLGMVESYNVIGEITGSKSPAEIIDVGAHLDSWDLGPGASDDGAGVVQSIEVLRAIRALGIHPQRTVRAVLFMAEEFGGLGGNEYAVQAIANHENHIAAMESDLGGFSPRGFSVKNGGAALAKLQSWKTFFAPYYADFAVAGASGMTDVEPLAPTGTAVFALFPDSQRYFAIHHSRADTIDKVNARELNLGAASMAILTQLISEQGLQ